MKSGGVWDIPHGEIKCGRIVKRASGCYLCLCIDAQPQTIPHVGQGTIEIDPGFSSLLTLSTGEKIAHPHELRQTEKRLAQAQRGKRKRLTAQKLHRDLLGTWEPLRPHWLRGLVSKAMGVCGVWAVHDRDVNAAINTRIAGVGITLEHRRKAVPGIPWL
jgi:transposase